MKNIFVFIIVFMSCIAEAQTCLHKDLSKEFMIRSTKKKTVYKDGNTSYVITVFLYRKKSGQFIQKIKIVSGYLFSSAYADCNSVRSYTTLKNTRVDVLDSDFGDVIVADLNFDGKEDLVLKYDSGGNAGPLYNFYLQDTCKQFVYNSYLSEQMKFFPTYFSKKKKTLTTIIHAGVCCINKSTFKVDTITGLWKQTGNKLIQ